MKGDLIGLPLCLSRASMNFGQLAILISIHIQIVPVFILFLSSFVCFSKKSSHAEHAHTNDVGHGFKKCQKGDP